MRYTTMIEQARERDELLTKKRLGKNQKATLATLSESLDSATVPPATPRRALTGEPADHQGNVFAIRSGKPLGRRAANRANSFGGGGVKLMRSRIQRSQRKQRTGGVR